jgi:hypothetical protein
MSFHSWLQNLRSALATGRGQRRDRRRGSPRAATRRPKLEVLEDRSLLSFSPATSFPVGANPRAVVTTDFNNDGRLDLATADSGANAVSVLLGNGQGGFGPAIHSAAGTGLDALAVGDFNNDGKFDLATTHQAGVSVLLGTGDGAFRPPVQVPLFNDDPLATAFSVAAADFNGDGKSDLVVTGGNVFGGVYGYIEVLLGDGTGVFTTSDSIDGFQTLSLLAVGDLNADGIPDLAVTDDIAAGTSWISVWLGNGDGTLRNSYWASGPSNLAGAVGDFTGDGMPDLVTAGETLDVRPGLGDGTFAPPSYSVTGSWQWTAAAADVNGDGALDVVTANWDTDTVSVLLGSGNGTLSDPFDYAAGSSPSAVAVADFNADGRPDVAAANVGSNYVSVLRNDGDWPDPTTPRLRLGDVTLTEGNTGTRTATFTVTLSAAGTQPITVAYTTGNGSATAGSDYQAASGTLTFAPGETSKTLSVLVNGDRSGEPTENFVINLSSPTNANIADGQGVGTITDDEPRISISDVTRSEGRKNQTTLFTFTVTLSVPYDQAVTMSFRTVDGTGTSSDHDYVAQTGTLTFAPGETSKTITIVVNGDNKHESNEFFYLDLFGNSSNSLFTKSRGIGTILNDD